MTRTRSGRFLDRLIDFGEAFEPRLDDSALASPQIDSPFDSLILPRLHTGRSVVESRSLASSAVLGPSGPASTAASVPASAAPSNRGSESGSGWRSGGSVPGGMQQEDFSVPIEQQQQQQQQRGESSGGSRPATQPPETPRGDADELFDMASLPIASALKSWVEFSMPFVLLLLGVFAYQHRVGLMVGAWIGCVFYFCNLHLRISVALRERRSVVSLSLILGCALLHIGVVHAVFASSDLASALLLLPPPEALRLTDILFVVFLNELTVRMAAMALKCLVLVVWPDRRPWRYARSILFFIDLSSSVYRHCLPLPLWYAFFVSDDFGRRLSIVLTLVYLGFKLHLLVELTASVADNALALLRGETQYGRYAAAKDLPEPVDVCPICQDDFIDPVVLSCRHCFCEECATEWFRANVTCPLCRAPVLPAAYFPHDGVTSIMPVVF